MLRDPRKRDSLDFCGLRLGLIALIHECAESGDLSLLYCPSHAERELGLG
jgi:hypothetical protein